MVDGVSPWKTGHEFYRADGRGPWRSSYFQGGTYDSGQRSFAVDPNGAASGPDWRQRTIVWNDELLGGDTVYVSSLESESLEMPYGYSMASLQPYRTERQDQVYHNGSLAQAETAVFLGLGGDTNPKFETVQQTAYQNDALGHTTNITVVDISNPSQGSRVIYEASYLDANGQAGELLRYAVDASGLRTEYFYDSLKRLVEVRGLGVTNALASISTTSTNFILDVMGRVTKSAVSSGSLGLTNEGAFDLAGRLRSQTTADSLQTTFEYSDQGRTVTTTLPSSAQVVKTVYPGGRVCILTGSGTVAEFHSHATNISSTHPNGVTLLDTVYYGVTNSPRWKGTGMNNLGLQTLIRTPDFGGNGVLDEEEIYVEYLHQPATHLSPGKEPIHFDLDNTGQVGKTWQGPSYDLASLSRISTTARAYREISGAWFLVETNSLYLVDGSAQPSVASVEGVRP